jgi:hypothetical protein
MMMAGSQFQNETVVAKIRIPRLLMLIGYYIEGYVLVFSRL